MEQTELFNADGRVLRDAGAFAAAERADRVNGGNWQADALAFLRYFGRERRVAFTIADVRREAEATGSVEPPPDSRAWGAIAMKAKREGWLRPQGWVNQPDPVGHSRPNMSWLVRG